MAKKTPVVPDAPVTVTAPAVVPTVDEIGAALDATPVSAEAPAEPEAPWVPPAGCIVTNDTTYIVWIDGTRYEHVSEAPDGRWVYRRS